MGKTKPRRNKDKRYPACLSEAEISTILAFLTYGISIADKQIAAASAMHKIQPDNNGHVKQLAYAKNGKSFIVHLGSVLLQSEAGRKHRENFNGAEEYPAATR